MFAAVLGIIAFFTSRGRSHHTALAVAGLALGAITLGHWVWVILNIDRSGAWPAV